MIFHNRLHILHTLQHQRTRDVRAKSEQKAKNWHGPLSTTHLYKLGGRRDKLQHTKRMRQLVTRNARADRQDHGVLLKRCYNDRLGFLGGWTPRNLHQVYDLTEAGRKALAHRYQDYGHDDQWEHRLMRATITAEMEIGVNGNRDLTFIPRHRTTSIPNGYELGGRKFRDDGMFSIDYAGSQRIFFLEVDRGTEVKEGMMKRKTIERMIRQWDHFLKREDGRPSPFAKHFNTYLNALVLFVFVNETQMQNAMEIDRKIGGSKTRLYRFDPRFAEKTFPAPMPSLAHWTESWLRVGHSPFFINDPDKQ